MLFLSAFGFSRRFSVAATTCANDSSVVACSRGTFHAIVAGRRSSDAVAAGERDWNAVAESRHKLLSYRRRGLARRQVARYLRPGRREAPVAKRRQYAAGLSRPKAFHPKRLRCNRAFRPQRQAELSRGLAADAVPLAVQVGARGTFRKPRGSVRSFAAELPGAPSIAASGLAAAAGTMQSHSNDLKRRSRSPRR